MKILMCFKFVLNVDDYAVKGDRTIDKERAEWIVSPYDLNAVESSMLLAKAAGATVEMLTVGTEAVDNSKNRKTAMSRGPEKLYAVRAQNDDLDNYGVVSLLAKAIERIGDVDLVICGEGSGDMYSMQIGNMLGSKLGWATLNSVKALRYEDGKVVAVRASDSNEETFAINGKAVLAVTSDICRPRIPSVMEIIKAGKKPFELWPAEELGGETEKIRTESVLAPEQTERKQLLFHECDEDELDEFCKAIKKAI